MLQWLSRRWWGVSGWGYLLSLGLAVGMYWMLLGSHAVHQWTFERSVQIKGFSDDLECIIVKQDTSEGPKYSHLNLKTGATSTHPPNQFPDYLPIDEYKSRFTSLWYSKPNTEALLDEITLRLISNGITLETVQCNAQGLKDWLIELAKLEDSRHFMDSFRDKPITAEAVLAHMKASKEKLDYSYHLSLKGQGACSEDGRWLILTLKQDSPIQAWAAWLKKKFHWKVDISRIGSSFSTLVIDLTTHDQITCTLSIHNRPTYAIHPVGVGFAVLQDAGSIATPNRSTIDWVSLPLGSVPLSIQQWCLILAAFGVPVVLSMLWNTLRRKRSVPVPVPPHP